VIDLRLVRAGRKGLSLQQTNGSMPGGSRVCELLGAYQEVLDTIGELPLVPMVLWRRRRLLHYLPRPRWLLRFFVVRHVGRVLASLGRRYSARAALGSAADAEQQDREAVREFQQSLPPTRQNLYLIVLIVATIVVGRPVIDRVITQAFAYTQGGGRSELRREAREMVKTLGEAVSVDFTSANRAVNALLSGGLIPVAVVTLGLALSLYVVLRPFVPAFRLKRMLFNLAPDSEGHSRSAIAGWSVSHATGIYERERRLLEELGGRPPRESPFDLIVPALLMLLPLAWGGLALVLALIDPEVRWRVYYLSMAAFMLILTLARLGWLYQTWQRRQSGRPGPYMPFEVRIRGSGVVAKVERPLGVRVLLFLLIFLFVLVGEGYPFDPELTFLGLLKTALLAALGFSIPVSLLWWDRMDREVRDLAHSPETRKSQTRSDLLRLTIIVGGTILLSAFINPSDRDILWEIVGGIVLFLAFMRTGRDIRRAQARAGQRESLRFAWMLAPGLLLHPFLLAYLQHELNKVWAVEGEPLDPSPADASRDATGTMPWLRGSRGQTTEPAGGEE
jgi:hypothetical protein